MPKEARSCLSCRFKALRFGASRLHTKMLGVRLPRAALLARDRARSDDLEADDGPDPVPPPAEPPIHPFTGKFAYAEHTSIRSRTGPKRSG